MCFKGKTHYIFKPVGCIPGTPSSVSVLTKGGLLFAPCHFLDSQRAGKCVLSSIVFLYILPALEVISSQFIQSAVAISMSLIQSTKCWRTAGKPTYKPMRTTWSPSSILPDERRRRVSCCFHCCLSSSAT